MIDSTTPFIHKFQTTDNYYIYDVYTNQFILVDDVIFQIIDDYGVLSNIDVISKWEKTFSESNIKKALNAIDEFQRKGYFLPGIFTKMKIPMSKDDIIDRLENNIKHIVLNLTEKCNMRCKYCVYGGTYFYERNHSNLTMNYDVIKKAISFYINHSKKHQYKCISFYGGEPLLVYNRIKYSKDVVYELDPNNNYKFRIDTNGLMIKDCDLLEFLVKNECELQVSIDGPKLAHDKYRVDINGEPTHDRIIDNLERIYNKYINFYNNNVSFATTVSLSNNLLELNNYYKENHLFQNHNISISSINVNDTKFFELYPEELYSKQREEINQLKDNYIKARINNTEPTIVEESFIGKNLVAIHARMINESSRLMTINGCCIPGLKKIFVSTTGEYHPCEKVGNAILMGDVDKGINIDYIFNTMNTYIENSEKECLKCWGAKLCGVCFANTRTSDKLDFIKKGNYCETVLQSLHNNFIIYATIMEKNPHAFDFVKNMVFE